VEFGDGRERAGLDRQPPKVGEHADEILRAAGYSAREIADLGAAGVLGAIVPA
jgi:crotonobetainyl-CoA:carnitine CoA-transferase CaiB-like acyl-CoA transferase